MASKSVPAEETIRACTERILSARAALLLTVFVEKSEACGICSKKQEEIAYGTRNAVWEKHAARCMIWSC
jgi:hypothetical protein